MPLSHASFSVSHPYVDHSLKKTSISVLKYCLKILMALSAGSYSIRGAWDPLVCKKRAAAIFSINILGQALVFKWSAMK